MSTEERWLPVPGGWETVYEVSDRGRVRRLVGGQHTRAGRFLTPYRCGRGLMVHLTRTSRRREHENGRFLVHRLVWAAFVEPLTRCDWVVPVNGDPHDARLVNLVRVPNDGHARRREREKAA
jgi:hypothetical protein